MMDRVFDNVVAYGWWGLHAYPTGMVIAVLIGVNEHVGGIVVTAAVWTGFSLCNRRNR